MEYEFRPALLSPQVKYTLEGNTLTCFDPAASFDLEEVTQFAVIRHTLRDSVMWRIDLHVGETLFRASYNGNRQWSNDPEALSFIALCSNVARCIGEINPEFEVIWG